MEDSERRRFAARQRQAWSAPPVDDHGYVPAAQLLALPDDELKSLVGSMRAVRYSGWRNYQGRWRDLMGLDELRGQIVLDFGCGTGVESLELAVNNHVALADIAPANIRLAARVLRLHGFTPVAVFVVHEFPPFCGIPPASLDVFYASGVLHHIPWAREVMAAAHGWLRPGGQARLMLYSDQGWRQHTGGTEPPAEVTTHPQFEAFVRASDAVGEYADWYSAERLQARFGDWFTVERCDYLGPDRRYLGAVLRRKP